MKKGKFVIKMAGTAAETSETVMGWINVYEDGAAACGVHKIQSPQTRIGYIVTELNSGFRIITFCNLKPAKNFAERIANASPKLVFPAAGITLGKNGSYFTAAQQIQLSVTRQRLKKLLQETQLDFPKAGNLVLCGF